MTTKATTTIAVFIVRDLKFMHSKLSQLSISYTLYNKFEVVGFCITITFPLACELPTASCLQGIQQSFCST